MQGCEGVECSAVNQLEGFTIGITADRRGDEQAELLRRRGAEVVLGATIHTENWADDSALARATKMVISDPPDVLIASTGIGIRGWLAFAETQSFDHDLLIALSQSRIVARGPKAAGALSQAGLTVDEVEATERLDDLVSSLVRRGIRDKVVAIQLFGAPAPGIIATLEGAGARVVPIPVYEWTLPDDEEPAKRLIKACLDGRLDAVTFTSAPALAQSFVIAGHDGHADPFRSAMNDGVVCVCVGPVTAAAARALGIGAPIWPERGRLGLMVRRLGEVLHTRHRHLRAGIDDVVLQGCTVRSGSRHVMLTPRERAVLHVLARRPGAVVARQALLREVWGRGSSPHVVDITVGRLRQRLEPVGLFIQASPRRGYRLDCPSVLSA